MTSRSARLVGFIVTLFRGHAVVNPVFCGVPATQAAVAGAGGRGRNGGMLGGGTEWGGAAGGGTAVGVTPAEGNCAPTLHQGWRALTSLATRVWLVPSVNSAIRRLTLGVKTPRVCG